MTQKSVKSKRPAKVIFHSHINISKTWDILIYLLSLSMKISQKNVCKLNDLMICENWIVVISDCLETKDVWMW